MGSYLFVNQAYYPDRVATAQLLHDLCLRLSERGHRVTVLAGDRGYDSSAERYARRERLGGIDVHRIPYASLGKSGRLKRAASFASFHARLLPTLLTLPRCDVAIALTSPPLVGSTVAVAAGIRRMKLVHWIMDLNPDEAVAAGWLREGGAAERLLRACARRSYRGAERLVALDADMKARLVERYGVTAQRIEIIPPWDPGGLSEDAGGAALFRRAYGLTDKYVVMYSGNHSPCHPLDTLLEAAARLRDRDDIVFCFVGGGSGTADVARFVRERGPAHILQLPYQPIEKLSASLSAADLHAVVMGTSFVGIVHPSKIYGILAVRRPFVLIGPERCAIGDMTRAHQAGHRVDPGDAEGLAAYIRSRADRRWRGADAARSDPDWVRGRYDRSTLLERWTGLLERMTESG